uniref:Uncharacterized protein n=1 Tax=Laticauda laticaudata TaxID=8630 RepID=A0A8C5SH64_LATLA
MCIFCCRKQGKNPSKCCFRTTGRERRELVWKAQDIWIPHLFKTKADVVLFSNFSSPEYIMALEVKEKKKRCSQSVQKPAQHRHYMYGVCTTDRNQSLTGSKVFPHRFPNTPVPSQVYSQCSCPLHQEIPCHGISSLEGTPSSLEPGKTNASNRV